MATVTDVLLRKGHGVASIAPYATVLDAAQHMNRLRIGSLVVVEGPHTALRGIITERDILTRVVAGGLNPRATTVEEVMTRDVVTAAPTDRLDHVREIMHTRRIRHVPIVDGTGLCGLISIGDVNAWHAETLEIAVTSLEEYIQRG
ncbi:MAG: CBS domain-containing protein [Phycisphaerales bacterium]